MQRGTHGYPMSVTRVRTLPPLRTRRLPFARSVATAARWPPGVLLTSWRYMWRTTPMYRAEEPGSWREDAPPSLPDGLVDEDAQLVDHGAGPLYHRRYRARIREPLLSPEELIARLKADPDCAAPTEFVTFRKVAGEGNAMRPGHEYVVRMPGPWDGPVRVVESSPHSFGLMTLAGHLEAGQIVFRARGGGELLEFEIESWARSGDRMSDLLYDRLRMSKEIQLHMWISFLEGVIRLSGGRRDGGLRIDTRRIENVPLPS
jgi:hypothetical protein